MLLFLALSVPLEIKYGRASRKMLFILPKFPMLNSPNSAYYARIMTNCA
jgi:hypothetical protein